MYISMYQHQSKDFKRVCFVITLIVKNNQQMRHCIDVHQDFFLPPPTPTTYLPIQELGALMFFKIICIKFVNDILKLLLMKKKIEKR